MAAIVATLFAAFGLALGTPGPALGQASECNMKRLGPNAAILGPAGIDVAPDRRGLLVFHKRPLDAAETISCRIVLDCAVEPDDLERFSFNYRRTDTDVRSMGVREILRVGDTVDLIYANGKPKRVCGVVGFGPAG